MKKSKLLFLFCILFYGIAMADVEPGNDNSGTTTDVLPMGGTQSGQNSPSDQIDFYQLTSAADGNITITLSNTGNEYAYLHLYYSDGTNSGYSTQGYAQSGIQLNLPGLAAGNYYVRVYCPSGQIYTLNASMTSPPQSNDLEPNDNPATALAYTVNSTITGHIAFHNDGSNYDLNDYYVFTTGVDGNINITFSNDNNNYLYVQLLDNDGTTQLGASQGYPQSGLSFNTTGLAAGTYYIHVYTSSGNFSGYTLSTTLTPSTYQNDGVNNNYFSTAPSFAQNDSIEGHIGYRNNGGSYDNSDFFSFYSNGDYDITINLQNENNNYAYIFLYDTDTITQLGATQGYAQSGISLTVTGLAAGTYYIQVYTTSGNYAGYKLKNSYTASPIINDTEPNNTVAQAVTTTYNATNTGHIAYRQIGGSFDTNDYYVFTTPADGNINLNIINDNNHYLYLYLLDSDGTTQLGATQGYAQGGLNLTVNGLSSGTYYVLIYVNGGNYSGYTLTKSLTPTPYTNDAEPNDSAAIALNFSPNSTVTGHIAHRYNGGTADNNDYYKIVTAVDGNISLSVSNDNNNYLYLYLLDSDGVTQLASTQGYAQSGISCSKAGLAAGTYYALVYTSSSTYYAGYSLSNSVTPALYNNDTEPNNAFATAAIMNNNASKQGHIGYRFNGGSEDNSDYWKISMLQADSMRIDLTMESNNYSYIYMYDNLQNQIYSAQGYNTTYSIFFNSLPAGDYYLLIHASSNTYYNSYTVSNFYYPCSVSPSVINAGGPTTFCSPGSVNLNTLGSYASYLWSNAATTNSIVATTSGTFSVIATDYDGCPHVSNSIAVTALTPSTYYADADGDGFGDPAVDSSACAPPVGYVLNNTDCNDANNTIYPGATEVCGNGIDDDCDGQIDEGCGSNTWYADVDSDTYGDINNFVVDNNPTPPSGYVANNTDCNDANAAIHPGATEIVCNGIDENCNGMADDLGTPSTDPTSISSDAVFNEICLGGNTTLTVNGGSLGTGANWQWYSGSCGGTAVGTGSSITVSPATATTYFVRAEGGCGNSNCVSLTITVKTSLPAQAVVVPPINGLPAYGCPGSNAAINVPVVANASQYIWDGPSGTYFNGNPLNTSPFISSTPSVQITFGTTNSSFYNIGVQAANACGATLRKIQKVRYKISTPGNISGAVNACANSSNTYSIAAVTSATQYLWSITGDATVVGNGTTVTVNFGPAWTGGNLCVAAQTPCFTSPIKCMLISAASTALNAINGTFTACPGNVITYNVAPSAGAAYYTWTLPSGATGSSTTNSIAATFTPSFNSGGNICVTVTSACGVTSAPKCKTITPGLPARPGAITGPSNGLCSQSSSYSVVSSPGITYNWTAPGTITGNGTNAITVAYGSFTTGSVCVTASNSCGTSAARCITIKGAPNTPVALTANPSSWCANTSGIEFTANVSNTTGSYALSWTYPAAPVATYISGGGNSNTLTLDWGTGNGTVIVKASNSCGEGSKAYVVNIGCKEAQQIEIGSLSAYPNPTSGLLNIEFNAGEKGNVSIAVNDLLGRTIMNSSQYVSAGSNNLQLDLTNVAKGAYTISVKSNQLAKQIKVLVE